MPDPIAPVKPQTDTDTEVIERYQSALAIERPDRVIIHNDDVTTFDFVIAVLITIFEQSAQRADDIAMEAHTNGLAFVCSLPTSEARKRVQTAHDAARSNNFPLRFTIEPGWLGN